LGRFVIQDIRPGPYRVGVSAKGYVSYELAKSSSFSVAAALNIKPDSTEPLNVRMIPAATISGRVTNSDRRFLKGVNVYLLHSTFDVDGQRKLLSQRMTTTSDSGEYVFNNLAPGPYYVVAGRGPSLIEATSAQPLYGWTFYPGHVDASLAARIEVSAGESLGGFDFNVNPQQTRQMRGTLIDSGTNKPPKGANIFLRFNSPFESSTADLGGSLPYDSATGSFHASGLIDGVYAVGVDRGVTSANERIFQSFPRDGWQQFEISGSDANDIVVRVPRSGYIHGRIIVEGTGELSKIYPEQRPSSPTSSAPQVILVRTTSLQPLPVNASADTATGVFEIPNALLGKYRLQVQGLPAGYYAKSVRVNGAQASYLLDFHPEVRTQLDITIAQGAAELRGVIFTEHQEPVAGASGLLLPDPLPQEVGYFRTFVAETNGAFIVSSLRPGKYRIYAFEGLGLGEFPESDLLRSSANRATPVDVVQDSKLSITVRLATRRG
jgi:hypothetical protein